MAFPQFRLLKQTIPCLVCNWGGRSLQAFPSVRSRSPRCQKKLSTIHRLTICFRRPYKDPWQFIPFDGPILNEAVTVAFPIGNSPTILKYGHFEVTVINGSPELVTFWTWGVRTADDVLAALKVKYGPPTASGVGEAQNGFGAKFSTMTAEWTLPDIFVSFESVFSDLEHGRVIISTKEGEKYRHEQAQKEPARPTL